MLIILQTFLQTVGKNIREHYCCCSTNYAAANGLFNKTTKGNNHILRAAL